MSWSWNFESSEAEPIRIIRVSEFWAIDLWGELWAQLS
jgi:hypothetical protein